MELVGGVGSRTASCLFGCRCSQAWLRRWFVGRFGSVDGWMGEGTVEFSWFVGCVVPRVGESSLLVGELVAAQVKFGWRGK